MIAVVDYGRGNLGSVEKAFGRVGMPAVITQDPREPSTRPTRWCCPATARSTTRWRTSIASASCPRCVGRSTAAGRFSASASAISCCSRERGVRRGTGLDVMPGAVRRFPPDQDPAHGLESRGACGRAAALRRHPGARTSISSTRISRVARTRRALTLRRRLVRVRREVCRCDRGGADPCDAVPSREEPAVGAPHARELRRHREGAAGDRHPGDRPARRPLRTPASGPQRSRNRVLGRSGRGGLQLVGARRRAAARRGPRRRVRR